MDRTSAVHAPVCGGGRFSDRIGVVDRKCMQIPQLTKATLDVRHVDLDIILEATEVGGINWRLDVIKGVC